MWGLFFFKDLMNYPRPTTQLAKRRDIAIKFQRQGWSQARLIKAGYERDMVRKWKLVDCLSPDAAFSDLKRSGRPRLLSNRDARKMMKKELETDVAGVVETAAI